MNTTTTETWQKHERPCFCDTCLPCTLYDQLGERAKLLWAALTDRLYADGFEQILAEELIAAIPGASRAKALEVMAYDHISPRIHSVDCLLDETDVRSYQVVSEMSRILLDAIYEQDAAPRALRILIVNEISERAGYLH